MMHSRERVTGGRPSCPWSPNLPWSPAANCGAYPALSEIQVSHIVAKLGGTTELFGPLYGDLFQRKGLYGDQTGRLRDLGEHPEGTGQQI